MIATDVTEEADGQNWGKDWHGHDKCFFLDVNITAKMIPGMMTTPLIQIILQGVSKVCSDFFFT